MVEVHKMCIKMGLLENCSLAMAWLVSYGSCKEEVVADGCMDDWSCAAADVEWRGAINAQYD